MVHFPEPNRMIHSPPVDVMPTPEKLSHAEPRSRGEAARFLRVSAAPREIAVAVSLEHVGE
jgi:hypothetical protein